MRFTNNLSRMARVLGATVLTAAAALTLGAAPAEAKPPSHAPAHGYRAKHQDNHRNHRHDRDRHDHYDRHDRHDHDRHDRNRRYDYRSNGRNRYSRYNRDNRTWLDWDRDGIPNSRDRHPRDSRRH